MEHRSRHGSQSDNSISDLDLGNRPWLVISFINQPSPIVLKLIIVSFLLMTFGSLAISPFVLLDRKVRASGEVFSELGIRSVQVIKDGTFRRTVSENQAVREGDRLGYIEMRGFDESDLDEIEQILKQLVALDPARDLSILKPKIEELKTAADRMRSDLTEAEVGLLLADIRTSYLAMLSQKEAGRISAEREVAPLKLSLKQLEKKTNSLKKGKRVRDLAFFIESIEEEARRIKSSIAQIENGHSNKMTELFSEFRSKVQRALVLVSTISRGSNVLSPISGRLYKFHLQDKQQVTKGSAAAEIIPIDSRLAVRMAVRANDQPKVQVGQAVHLRLEAFPYQRYGTLLGQVTDVKPVSQDGTFEVRASIMPSERIPIEKVPIGSRVSAQIVTEKESLLRIAIEKVIGDWK